jgi:hypothetical protein
VRLFVLTFHRKLRGELLKIFTFRAVDAAASDAFSQPKLFNFDVQRNVVGLNGSLGTKFNTPIPSPIRER